MTVNDERSALEWLQSWGDRAFTLNRASRLADDMRTCAGMCPDYRGLQVSRAGYLEAERTLRRAIAANAQR